MTERLLTLLNELKIALRSLRREKGLTATVIITLALGIGANAVIFSLVRAVLLRPLVNRDESRLVYIRQSGEGENVRSENFSIPEIDDLRSRSKSFSAFGDFSSIGFTMEGLGEPRTITGGVVGGSYFKVMGLRPVLGRLLDQRDDGPNAPGAVVLTYRFWSKVLQSDPSVLNKTIRLNSFVDARTATIVGVLEPCVPYPQETEIIGNVVTSAHHLSATMQTSRLHRMTQVFARLKPGVELATARAEIKGIYAQMKHDHPDAYPVKADYEISVDRLRDELTHGAKTILLVLMITSVLVFVIACSNVANLTLARSIRRESELGVRAAMGATTGDLRRTLLAESLLLCLAGAALGLLIAGPMIGVLARYMSRYSVRALDLSLDPAMLWVGAGLALAAAALLAFIPRLPTAGGAQAFGLVNGGTRVTGVATRKLRIFAVVQIAASFVLIASAGASINTLLSLQSTPAGFETRNVLVTNVPVLHSGRTPAQVVNFYGEIARRIRELPGVQNVALGMYVPWRDQLGADTGLQFTPDTQPVEANGGGPHARIRVVSSAFFATLGLPVLEGRDFDASDTVDKEPVALISESLARQIFTHGDPLNHHVSWTDPILKAVPFVTTHPIRVIGVVPDMDDSDLVPHANMSVYMPVTQVQTLIMGRLFIHATSNPYALVQPVTRVIHKLSSNQPVEEAATLADVRTQVLSSDRLNAIVFAVFAAVALLIAIVGVAGVLAFSVSGRTREFGIRLAIGSQPRSLLFRVMSEGAAIALFGLGVGMLSGYALAQLAGSILADLKAPGALPVALSALVLLLSAVVASVIPAARAARVDVMQALRSE